MNWSHDSTQLLNSRRFKTHTAKTIKTIDTAMNLLGPDNESLTEVMHDLGRRHVGYGVKPCHFPVLGEALIYTLKAILGEKKFGEKETNAFEITYNVLAGDMISGGNWLS